MKKIGITLLSISLVLSTLISCGGGGSLASIASEPGGGGIGGTGVTSSGPVTGFGSIFVNGVEYATDDADIFVNGARVGEDALGLGMVVVVRGSVNDDGMTGTASSVVFDGAVQGPVSAITANDQGDILLLTILGLEVIAERTATVFDAVTFDSVQINDLIEVSGFVDRERRLRATRLERKSAFVPAESEIDRAGTVTALNAMEFILGSFRVDFSEADLSALPGGTVTEGMRVLVRGTLSGTTITAQRISRVTDVSRELTDNERVIIQGAITEFENVGAFKVNGLAVDASEATLDLAGDGLRSGLIVQVAGFWNGRELVAGEVSSRQGQIAIAGSVSSVNATDGTVTLQLFNRTISVVVNTQTLIEDTTGQTDRPTLSRLSSGDFVTINAIARGDTLLAIRINRTAETANLLQAEVDSFSAEVDITLLGITIGTSSAVFAAGEDRAIGAAAFYDQLRVGDQVRITDVLRADGEADLVYLVPDEAAR